MSEVAPGVRLLKSFPQHEFNCYLVGDVLVDSGTFWMTSGLLRQFDPSRLSAHVITHAHWDHFGAARRLHRDHGVPIEVGVRDVDAVERGKMLARLPLLGERMLPAAPAAPVARALEEGDTVSDFTVLDTPGHSPGHISLWRESDRVLICGDVMWGHNPFTFRRGLRDPFDQVSPDPALNRRSARRLAELRPAVVCFGHGPVLRDPDEFRRVADQLG